MVSGVWLDRQSVLACGIALIRCTTQLADGPFLEPQTTRKKWMFPSPNHFLCKWISIAILEQPFVSSWFGVPASDGISTSQRRGG